MVNAPDDTDSSASRSTRGTPARTSIELPRTHGASKGGCWTCRLRRKKCDEQRIDNACQTCIRLRIKCLGWGTRRPDWMRNKQSVEQYKAEIKAQLTRDGLIRGQPRVPGTGHVLRGAARGTGRGHTRGTPRRSSTAPQRAATTNDLSFRFIEHDPTKMTPPMPSPDLSHSLSMPMSYSEPKLTFVDLPPNPSPTYPYSPPPSSSSPPSSSNTQGSDAQFDSFSTGFDYDFPPQNIPPLPGQNLLRGDLVLYYFENVRKSQYVFTGNSVMNIIYSLIVQEPQGAVTNAICALASLHYNQVCVAQGLSTAETNPAEESTAKYFYDEAFFLLAEKKQLHGQYSETDAIAALQLVNYSLLSGGITDWQPVLAVACDWLLQTGLVTDENPTLSLLKMSLAARFAVNMTMWMDVIASVTLLRPPKYLALYRRLLARDSGFWPGHHDDGFDLRLESLSGCPDEALLAIAEVSALAHWKLQEMRSGCLSVRELVRRGDNIERQLRQSSDTQAGYPELTQMPLQPPKLLPLALGQMTIGSNMASADPLVTSPLPIPFPDGDLRQSVAEIFRESALLYLHTILSSPQPGVPEIRTSTDTISKLLNQMPVSEFDCSLVFPICIAGCMSDDPHQREIFKGRLPAQEGNLIQARSLMEAVWQRRDVHGGIPGWREMMHEQGLNLLLI